jgi:hypothetical protein
MVVFCGYSAQVDKPEAETAATILKCTISTRRGERGGCIVNIFSSRWLTSNWNKTTFDATLATIFENKTIYIGAKP